MSILSRRGLSIVRYILLAFDVVFVCLLFCFLGGGEGGGYLFFCLLLVAFCCCFLFCFFVCFLFCILEE